MDFRVTWLHQLSSIILVNVNNAAISVIVCTLVLIFALTGTYIKKLLNDRRRLRYDNETLRYHNETKDISIIGLKEIIRLLEEKKPK